MKTRSKQHRSDDPVMQVGLYYYLGGPRFWEQGPAIPLSPAPSGWQRPDLSRLDYPTITLADHGLDLVLVGRHLVVIWQPPMLVLPQFPTRTVAPPPVPLAQRLGES